jgi:pimeloyl-ACP methyl ester carboxylesterase
MIAAVLIGLALVTPLLLVVLVVHVGFRAPRHRPHQTPADYDLVARRIRVPTRRHRWLAGWWLPAHPASPVFLVLHGWGSNAALMLPLAAPLRRAGYSILLIETRSHGDSDGDTFASLPRFAEDAEAALDWLDTQPDAPSGPRGLIGHSVGAGAVLLSASRRDDIAVVISIGAFAHPTWLTHRYVRRWHLPILLRWLVVRYTEWVIGYRFDAIAPLNTLRRVDCPVLLVHGTHDRVIPLADAEYLARTRAVDLLRIPEADHDSVELIEHHVPDLLRFLRHQDLGPVLGDAAHTADGSEPTALPPGTRR